MPETTQPNQPSFDPIAARAKAIVDKLFFDRGEGGKAIRQTAKELYPEITLPDDGVEAAVAPIKAELDALKAEREAEKTAAAEALTARQAAEAEANLKAKLDAARAEFNLTDAGLDAVVQRMKDTGNYADPSGAAAYVLKDEKPAQSQAPYLGPQDLDFLGKDAEENAERMKLLHSDPDGKFLDYEFAEFAKDPDKYARTWAPEYFNR